MGVEISSARGGDLARVRALFRAYAEAIDFDLACQGFEAELSRLPGRYAPPGGTLLLARDGAAQVLGCVGVRGRAARSVAAGAGYREMRLDTLPRMRAAIALYRALGFAPIPAPADDPGLGQLYFTKVLAPG